MWSVRKTLSGFKGDQSGQVAVFFALMAVPLIAITSASVDYTNAVREKQAIKGALDAALIAAVNNNAIELSEKPAFAETHFRANYSGSVDVVLTPSVEESAVSLVAGGEIKLTFGQLIGIKNPIVADRSAAIIASENTICVLALSTTEKDAVKIDGDLTYLSPRCTVHSNSSNKKSLVSKSSVTPRAKSFCTVGGAEGNFLPYSKGECKPIEDPYASVPAPYMTPCAVTPSTGKGKTKGKNKDGTMTGGLSGSVAQVMDTETGLLVPVSENLTGSLVTLVPGTYCAGLTVDGVDVDFMPGEYIMRDGPLTFMNGAEATARDVTFILVGENAVFNVETGANVLLKAPSTGFRKGLAVMEAEDPSAPGNRKVKKKKSTITGGGNFSVLGTVYLPKQTLEVKGDGTQVGSKAPATSFIADRVHFKGENGAVVEVDIDHAAAGIPPILPKAEDGAMLIE